MLRPTDKEIQIKERKSEEHRTEEFFNLIIDTIKEGLENKGIKEEVIKTPSELKGYAFDLPKKEKGIYHGSSFDILCGKSTWCETHRHLSHKNVNIPPESHIHFM